MIGLVFVMFESSSYHLSPSVLLGTIGVAPGLLHVASFLKTGRFLCIFVREFYDGIDVSFSRRRDGVASLSEVSGYLMKLSPVIPCPHFLD